jgi:hypothetical protein
MLAVIFRRFEFELQGSHDPLKPNESDAGVVSLSFTCTSRVPYVYLTCT